MPGLLTTVFVHDTKTMDKKELTIEVSLHNSNIYLMILPNNFRIISNSPYAYLVTVVGKNFHHYVIDFKIDSLSTNKILQPAPIYFHIRY